MLEAWREDIDLAVQALGSVPEVACFLVRRRTNLGTDPTDTNYQYDGASRFSKIYHGVSDQYSAHYFYEPYSELVKQIDLRHLGTNMMSTVSAYDYLNRLKSIHSTNLHGIAVAGASYLYNAANQRIQNAKHDGSRWNYQYDELGQVTSGKKYWPDGTPVAGQQYEYAFDDIGNRRTTQKGGDEFGAHLRQATYTVNDLNQYTSRSVPGQVDILGIAHAQASVTVDGNWPYRKGEYFREELELSNSSSYQFTAVTNVAWLDGNTNTVTGNVFLAKTPESFAYDVDGNITSDGRWSYTWDGENRLIEMETIVGITGAAKRKLKFQL